MSARSGPTVRDRLQYAVLRAFAGVLGMLSWRAATNLAGHIGTLFYAPLGIRKRVAEKQIAAAFPEYSSREVMRVARESYRHLGRVAAETALLSRLDTRGVLEHFGGSDGLELLQTRIAEGHGAIVLTGHLGNWELAGAMVAAHGMPIDVVVRLMGNPLFDEYLTRTRTRLGMTVVRDRDAVRQTPRSLRGGRVIAFLSDQSALHIASILHRLLRPAREDAARARSVRAQAQRAGRSLARVFERRMDATAFMLSEIVIERTGTPTHDIDAIVTSIHVLLEHYVRASPEQYFWQHRRWKRQPANTPPELLRSRVNALLWRRLRADRRAMLGLGVVAILVVLAIAAPLVSR